MLREEKAQTATEYLLIIGGAVAVATAVGIYIKTIPPRVPIQEKTEELVNPNP